MKTFSISLLLSVILFASCKTEPKDFNIIFKLESLNSYKIELNINSDKSYSIKQQNIIFDRMAKQENIQTAKGEMTDEEWKELTRLIAASHLFRMKNNYGFSEQGESPNDPLSGILYHINYKEKHKEKYILIHPSLTNRYPRNLSQLIIFLSNFTSDHSKT